MLVQIHNQMKRYALLANLSGEVVKATISVSENRWSPMSCRNHPQDRALQQRLVHMNCQIRVLLVVKGVP